MMFYIPDNLYNDLNNRKEVEEILATIDETCLRIPDVKCIEDARREIKKLGEHKVADSIIIG